MHDITAADKDGSLEVFLKSLEPRHSIESHKRMRPAPALVLLLMPSGSMDRAAAMGPSEEQVPATSLTEAAYGGATL
eukprot:SAG11_NODE_27119_length_336_cov_1.527426_1_plen_76_part_01